MKTLFCIIMLIAMTAGLGLAEDGPKMISPCPKTLIAKDCMTCHVMSGGKFTLKESAPDAHLDMPIGTRLIDYPDNPKGVMEVGEIGEGSSDTLQRFFAYLKRHKIKTAILRIYSGGGSLFDAWRMKSYINVWQEGGGIVQSELHGFAASAATIVFLAANKGYRIANPQSEMMFHELSSWEGGLFYIKKNTPSSTEEQARIFAHLQKTINDWVPTRGNISPEDFASKVRAREFWLTGQEAYDCKYGFVDRLIKGD